jgi:hypothetical protein
LPTETPNLPEQLHSRPGTAVATRSYGGSDSPGLDAGDILIPRLKFGQPISTLVAKRIVDFGAIYVVASRDDLDPVILAEGPPKGEDVGQSVRFYIHEHPRKGWSWTNPDKSLGRGTEYPTLSDVENQDPRKVRRTYDYLVTVPGYEMLPIRFLMHGQWGGQAAKQINTQLLLLQQKGIEAHTVAFKVQARLTSSPRDGQDRPFAQALVGLDKVTAKDKKSDVELVNSHRELVGGSNVQELDDTDVVASQPVDAPSLD